MNIDFLPLRFILFLSLLLVFTDSSQAQTTPTAALHGLGRHGVSFVVTGEAHTCAIMDTGSVKCWGLNSSGQLGLGDINNRGDGANEMNNSLPSVLLGIGRTARSIVAGGYHTCALLDNGSVKCWGDNQYGQLGLGNINNRGDGANEMGDNLSAVSLGTNRWAKSLTAGTYHTCAILDDNSLKCWGRNNVGQLGQGDANDRGDGASEMGDSLSAINFGASRWVRSAVAGGHHNCVILDNGTTKCWGQNSSGQLGQGDITVRGDGAGEMGDSLSTVNLGTNRSARSIVAGGSHNCVILDNGTTKCWGLNSSGQLGLGDTNNRGDAASEMGDSLSATNLGTNRSARSVVAGGSHNCVILDDGTTKCWGLNSSGQLGLGDTNNRGDAASEMGDSLSGISLGTNVTARSLFGGGASTCSLLDSGSLKCWGFNSSGQLGVGDVASRGDGASEMGDNLSSIKLGKSKNKIATETLKLANNAAPELFEQTGQSHNFVLSTGQQTCAILENSSVKCWGDNASGKLGLGDVTLRGDGVGEMGNSLPTVNLGTNRTARSISGRGNFNCVILDNGTLKCWGNGGSGQLGQGDAAVRGDGPNEMGDNLPAIDLGTNRSARIVVTGGTHACAILDNGTVKCWGDNTYGQLAQGDVMDRGNAANEMGDNLLTVNLGTNRTARSLVLGTNHSCAILDNGAIKCWGDNQFGQLGQGDINNRGDGANEMGDNLPVIDLGTGRSAKNLAAVGDSTCALLDNSSIKCWGRNNVGQLGLGDINNRGDAANEMGDNLLAVNLGTGRTARSLMAGLIHACAILDDATVKCWGGNAAGQLGQGDTIIRGNGANEMGDNLSPISFGAGRTVRSLLASMQQACVILDNGMLKCWGSNFYGQLGMGDTNNRGDGASEMGDNLRPVRLGR